MADIKREIRTIGQRLSGLTAGNKYTFVLKRPNVRVDVQNAERAIELAHQHTTTARKLLGQLAKAREDAIRGDHQSARGLLDSAKALVRDVNKGLSDAKEFAQRAIEDAKEVHADVKDAYAAAKDAAEQAVALPDKVMSGVQDVLKAIGAMVIEAEARSDAPPATDGK
jgi:F0F1-type ATP synthase membrane subunit b/b'